MKQIKNCKNCKILLECGEIGNYCLGCAEEANLVGKYIRSY